MVSACLVDVYGTLLTCDFDTHNRVLSGLAGISQDTWRKAIGRTHPADGVGQITRHEMFEIALRSCGLKPSEELLRTLIDTNLELMLGTGRLYDDALPFLEQLRSRGIATAIVSNCGEQTRPLLASLGILALCDTTVLSCEVGLIKPSPRIYRLALNELNAKAADAVFVDDQVTFCIGAEMTGVRGVPIVRDGDLPPGAVRSLLDVLG